MRVLPTLLLLLAALVALAGWWLGAMLWAMAVAGFLVAAAVLLLLLEYAPAPLTPEQKQALDDATKRCDVTSYGQDPPPGLTPPRAMPRHRPPRLPMARYRK